MRLHEICSTIVEYIAVDNNKLSAKLQNEPSAPTVTDAESFIKYLEDIDPTQKKKYVNWMITRYFKTDVTLAELRGIQADLDTFERLSRTKQIGTRDINQIKTIKDLKNIIGRSADKDTRSGTEKKKDVEQQFYDSGEAELLLDTNEYKVVVPRTEEASCYFGVNTKWCTASRDAENMFAEYNRNGNMLHIILHKPTNQRWQFYFGRNEFRDENDESIDAVKFLLERKPLLKLFKDLGYIKFEKDAIALGNYWYNKKGKLHRTNGPAQTEKRGDLTVETWYKNGKIHRVGGPAITYKTPDGKVREEIWQQNGTLHRADGPAIIEYDPQGNIIDQEWRFRNKPVNPNKLSFLDKIRKKF